MEGPLAAAALERREVKGSADTNHIRELLRTKFIDFGSPYY